MRLLQASRQVTIPEDVTVEVKGRQVRVKGPRGMIVLNPSVCLQRNAEERTCLLLSERQPRSAAVVQHSSGESNAVQ